MSWEIVQVFLLGILIDVLYVLWFFSVSKKSRLLAASVSMVMGLVTTESYLSIVDDRNLRIFYVLGLGAGTILGLYFQDWIDGLRRKDT